MVEHPDPDVLAEQMAPVALELVRRVRTDPPLALWRDLVAPLDGWQQAALIALLAAAVDPSVHPDVWWGWVRHRDVLACRVPGPPVEPAGWEPPDVDELIGSMVRCARPRQAIADATGLSSEAVKKRVSRLRRAGRLPAGDRAGVR